MTMARKRILDRAKIEPKLRLVPTEPEVYVSPDFELLEKDRVWRRLPRALKPYLDHEPVDGKRSDDHYHFAQELKEAGVEENLALSALMYYPPAMDKYGNRIRQEVARVWGKGASNGHLPLEDVLEVENMEDVPMEAVDWLWKDRIPLEALTLLAGAGGEGKSTWTSWLTAQVTQGRLGRPPATVLIISLEDTNSKTIKPRLKAAGADMRRVRSFRRVTRGNGESDVLRLPQDVKLIEEQVRKTGAELVLIDPLSAVLGEGKNYDAHRDSDVRRALYPVTDLAEKMGFALVAIVHLTKQKNEDLVASVLGSVAFTATARSVLMMLEPKEKEEGEPEHLKFLAHVKSNWSMRQPAVKITTKEVTFRSRTGKPISVLKSISLGEDWRGEEHLMVKAEKTESKFDQACDWLLNLLQESGEPIRAIDVFWQAESAGFSAITIRRAKKKLGVLASGAKGAGSRSTWRLPG